MSGQSDTLGGRLPLADPAALNPPQRNIFDRLTSTIVPWANDAHFQSTAEDGRLIGPFNPALLNPAITAPFLELQFAEQVQTFHVNGIMVSVLMPLLAGASVVIAEKFDPHTFFDIVERHRPTFFSAVPTIYNMLAALPGDVTPDTSSLRFGICGAAPASAELLGRFEARYGFPLIEGYGLSEGTCASTMNPVAGPRRPGTVGIAFPGQQIRIIDGAGTEVAPGVDGQITIAGPNIMQGYLGRPDETARVIINGWLHTGDIGHLDDEGYLTLVGRSKDMIIRGGENIYPKEIEDVLTSDPTVLEAAVIGVPDDKWGETVAAYVQPRPGHTINVEGLHRICASKLAGYKRPTSITVMDAIPKNPVGKTDKAPLRAAHLKGTSI
jgi:long-chain acyl-CoA synthetase